MDKKNNTEKLYLFLVEPKYKTWRYLIFILIGAIITFNQVFIIYQDCSIVLGNTIYLICLLSFLQYFIAMQINYHYLIPQFLLKEKYTLYIIILFLVVFSLPTLSIIEEYWMRNKLHLAHRINSYTSPLVWLDNLSSTALISICFLGISVSVLFQNWILVKEKVNKLEYEYLRAEVEKLKGQIAPEFLSRTLHTISELITIKNSKASVMVMQLGKLLRYQLYESSKEKVFLQTEIIFITDFLELEEVNKNQSIFKFYTQGNFETIKVYPSIFLSIIQIVVNQIPYFRINFEIKNNILLFQCSFSNLYKVDKEKLLNVQKRLDLLYSETYKLHNRQGIIELQLNIDV